MDNGELTESPQETLERAPYRAYWSCVAELVAAKRRITALEARERRVREYANEHWDIMTGRAILAILDDEGAAE